MEADYLKPEAAYDTAEMPSQEPNDVLEVTVHHNGTPHSFCLAGDSTLQELSDAIAEGLSIPLENQKLIISPKPGLQRPPFQPTPLSSLSLDSPRAKIVVLGSSRGEIDLIKKLTKSMQSPPPKANPVVKPARPHPRRNMHHMSFTFQKVLPLTFLPNPERSLKFLLRLRDDPGIRVVMARHKFNVPLLTEMDPAAHTTMSSRTLGLNRNKGQVIELRLRTDAYDGYRDYRTIRKTLCHELAHCVHSEHDRAFWDLTERIEEEVERADYWRRGKKISDNDFYNPDEWDEIRREGHQMDQGGWTGGAFVLGISEGEGSGNRQTVGEDGEDLSRREIMARAAESRLSTNAPSNPDDRSDLDNGADPPHEGGS
ncbi:hypothetical protein FQN57_003861 [Myotisia sp. PD_48]|nr:hypothetical protein FQN57_003861 [Myotisia sp. PD_48]